MKPLRIFIFFGAVLLFLFTLALLLPEQGIGIAGDLRISFVTLSDLFHRDSVSREVDVEQLLSLSMVTDDPEADPARELFLSSDSIRLRARPVVAPANVDSLQQAIYRIQFAEGRTHLLDPFFHTLHEVGTGEVRGSRILHFGDSQIENDRMTALIRYRLQKNFGGTGTGLVQAIPLYSGSMAYQQEQTGEWLRYTFFGRRDTTLAHNTYGLMGAFASVPSPDGGGEWPMLHYRFNTHRRSGQCDRIRIFLHSYVDSAEVVFQVNETFTDSLRFITDGFNVVDFRHYTGVRDLKIYLNLPEGGRIYGISFESNRGLHVDNIAMRGGSGLIFTKMNRDQQQAMMNHLTPSLILLQYGGNVVPYMNPGYYRRVFRHELQFFKEIAPGTPVIVIGPSDMSMKEKGFFRTYPGLEPIRDALKAAALESGFAFWDLYEAMGGYNSMPSFAESDPPLASKDHIHFTSLGVNLVAEMFYNSLMLEYNRYITQNQNR